MSLSADLLEQAQHLAGREPRRPRQASLRRAVSTATYAVFHLINQAAASTLAPNAGVDIQHRIQRWFQHGEMKRVCGYFLPQQLSSPLLALIGNVASSDLQIVARSFIELQEARHRADHDLSWSITRSDAKQDIEVAGKAFQAWERIAATSEANVFLLSLVLWKNWERS